MEPYKSKHPAKGRNGQLSLMWTEITLMGPCALCLGHLCRPLPGISDGFYTCLGSLTLGHTDLGHSGLFSLSHIKKASVVGLEVPWKEPTPDCKDRKGPLSGLLLERGVSCCWEVSPLRWWLRHRSPSAGRQIPQKILCSLASHLTLSLATCPASALPESVRPPPGRFPWGISLTSRIVSQNKLL